MSEDLLVSLGIALAIGLVVGLERGWRLRDEPEGGRVAGLRTYGLLGLLGGVAAALASAFAEPLVFAIVLAAFVAVLAWYHLREAERRNSHSITAAIAGILVFALGGLAVIGDRSAAVAGGVATASLLASREFLHGILQRLSWAEIRAALLLLVMTVIVLPILPNRAIDPWGGLNPFDVWLFTVLTAGISFAGYVAVRLLGPARGTIAATILGAVVSSTAVTIALGRRAKNGEPTHRLVGGAALAAMVSAVRVTVIVLIAMPQLASGIALPLGAVAVTFGVAGIVFTYRAGRSPDTGSGGLPGNPFELGPILIFAASFAVVSVISAAAIVYLGPDSILITSSLSGLLDADVASLSAARLAAAGTVGTGSAALAVLAAVASNGAFRVGAAAVAGTKAYWLPLAILFACALAAGLLAAWISGTL